MEVKDEYVADVTRYSGPLREAANDADRFGKANDKAALAARRMGLAAKEAADKAARAQRDAADAADKLARGEINAADAAKAAARAENELERASIKAAEAERAAAAEADKAAKNFKQMARDATLAAAAENLAMLKASGSVKDHNAAVLKLRKDMPELGKDGSNAFKLMTSASRSFGSGLDSLTSGAKDMTGIWRAVPGLVIAGIELLPTAAAAAGGAITLALGGALSYIGLKAQAGAADVKMAFSDMKQHVVSQIRQISTPFHDTLGHVAQDARTAFDSIAPSLKGAFANMAPALTRFSGAFAASFVKLRPAIDSIGVSFAKVLDSLGSRMGPIMGNFATSIQAITSAVAQNPTAFTGFVEGVSQITRYLGDGIGFLISYSHQFNTLFQTLNAFAAGPVGMAVLGLAKIKSALGGGDSSFSKLSNSAADAGNALTGTSNATDDLLTAQKAATMTSDQLKTALDALTGANQSAFDAETEYTKALAKAEKQAKANNFGIETSGKAWQKHKDAIWENRKALSDLAQAFKADLTGKTPAEILAMRNNFIKVAEGMGVSKAKAKELADQLLGVSGNMKKIPDKKNTDLTARDQASKTLNQVTRHFKDSWTSKIWRAQLTAQNKVAGAVSAAAGAAKRFAGALYRANLTALNRTGGVISGAASAARRFASAVYRASLTAVNNTWNALRDAFNAGNQWAGRVFTATFNVIKKLFADGGSVEGYADGGHVQRFPSGGQVHGPGTSTSDSIPIMVSNGEYVINAKQAAKHRELLDAINYGLDGYATGGKVARLHAAQARVDLARARPEYLAAMAAQQALASMRSSVYGGWFGGGPSTPGSAHGTVVQHITNVNVTVHGSVSAAQDLAKTVQRQLLTNRMPVALPRGR